MPERDDMTTAEGAGPEAPRRRMRFPLKSALALAVIALLGVPIFSMLQPGYYGRYPDLAARMGNWRQSTHARIPCSGCHVDPGARGYAKFAAKAIPAFYSQLIHGPRPANLLEVPGRSACQKCHTSYRQVSANGDLRIPHRAHVEVLEINCPTCHRSLVHSKNTQGFNSPEMSMCLAMCHDGKKASGKCGDCHTRKHVPDNHRAKDWLQVHSARTESVNCGECHGWTPQFCRECHSKRPKSHVGNWKKNHAPRAKARGGKGCLACHESTKFCKRCHD